MHKRLLNHLRNAFVFLNEQIDKGNISKEKAYDQIDAVFYFVEKELKTNGEYNQENSLF